MPIEIRRLHPCYFKFFLSSAFLALALGCKVDDAVTEAGRIRKQIDESTKAFERTLDKVALAVPGERYLRLIDAAHSTDAATREAAHADIKRLFGIEDLGRRYMARVEFLGNSKDPIHADAFVGPIATREWVEESCLAAACNDRPIGLASTRLPTRDDLTADLTKSLEGALAELAGVATVEDTSRDPCISGHTKAITIRDSALIPGGLSMRCVESSRWMYTTDPKFTGGKEASKQAISQAKFKRRQIAQKLATQFVDVRSELRLNPETSGFHLEVDWNLVSPSQVLFVIIREEDFNRHYLQWKGQFSRNERPIRARLHDAKDIAKLFNQRAEYAFDPDEFRDNQVVELQTPRRRFVWAAHNMTGAPSLSSEELQRHRDVLAKWAEVKDNN